MKKQLTRKIFFLLAFLSFKYAFAQSDSAEFILSGEFRPRTEYRNGYRHLPNDTTLPAFFTSSRLRLNALYKLSWADFYVSIQDVHVWGENFLGDDKGTLGLFEGYVNLKLDSSFAVKFGRQRLMLDNERLFAQNNWRQSGGAHDALRLSYSKKELQMDLFGAFNQNNENVYSTNYDLLVGGTHQYKYLGVFWLQYKLSDRIRINTINVADGYDYVIKKTVSRYTNGGKFIYSKNKNEYQIGGYYQWGKNPTGKVLNAYYLMADFKQKLSSKLTTNIGFEWFSGDRANDKNTDRSFSPLYGVAHRFNGYMDLFTRFPDDLKSHGLINPYLKFTFTASTKVSFKCDFHSFMTEQDVITKTNTKLSRNMGFENDWLILWKPRKEISTETGICWASATQTMGEIKGGDYQKTPHWFYFQISVSPELLKKKFKVSE